MVIRSALYSRITAKMLKKKNIGRGVTDFHENHPSPHILPSLTVTKSVYPPPLPLRDVINGWPLKQNPIGLKRSIVTSLRLLFHGTNR